MRKRSLSVIALLLSITLYGCSAANQNGVPQAENTVTKEEAQGSEVNSEPSGEPEAATEEAGDGGNALQTAAPTKEEVPAMREAVLEGMSQEEAERLTENIKVANQRMEHAWLEDDIFGRLEDKDSLYWNYFDEKGDIQIGWAYDGGPQEMRAIQEEEGLSEEEFYAEYGTPVTTYNRFDAENFIALLDDMKQTVQHLKLQEDLQQMMDETALAAETHEMEHANNVYKLLHDMDYYLLRYGIEDVGKYVQDASVIAKYYGVLSVYQSTDTGR